MCRRAGRAFGAFGAALDVEYARLEESKTEKSAAVLGSGSYTTPAPASETLSKRRLSGAPTSSTEPLRSELLAMQLAECANEMEDDLRAQVCGWVGQRQPRCWCSPSGRCCLFSSLFLVALFFPPIAFKKIYYYARHFVRLMFFFLL